MTTEADNSNIESAAPIYTERRNRGSDSSGVSRGLTIFLVVTLIIGSLAGVSWLYFDQIEQNDQLRSEFNQLKQSMVIIQEALQITDKSMGDLESARNKRLKNIDREIIKLWNLSNRKNKPNIKKLLNTTATNSKALTELKQDYNNKITKLTATSELVKKMQDTAEQQISTNLEQIKTATQSIINNSNQINTFKNNRSSINSRLVKLQKEVNLLRNKVISIENNLPIPSHDLENPAR